MSNGRSRPGAPSDLRILKEHSQKIEELRRKPGRWIYVGDYPGDAGTTFESPPFQNGWSNSGGGFPRLSFYIDKWQRVHMRGAVSGGTVGTVITTVPAEYCPAESERFSCPGDTGPTVIQVDPNGDVTQVS